MTLNSSGPISLGGSTSGQSINLELGQSATTQVSLNDSNVRTLAGVASGAIVMPIDFWGKSSAGNYWALMTPSSGNVNLYGNAFRVNSDKSVTWFENTGSGNVVAFTFNPSGTLTTQKIGSLGGITGNLNYLAIDSSGNLYFYAKNSSTVYTYKINTSNAISLVKSFSANASVISSSTGTVDSSGYLYIVIIAISSNYTGYLYKTDSSLAAQNYFDVFTPTYLSGCGVFRVTSPSMAPNSTSTTGRVLALHHTEIDNCYNTSTNAFVYALDKNWRVSFASNLYDDGCPGVNVDSSGNVYIFHGEYGYFRLYKIDTNGNFVWAREIPWFTSDAVVNAWIQLDSSGNVYVAFVTWYYQDSYIIKYNSSGTLQWSRYIGQYFCSCCGLNSTYISGFQISPNDTTSFYVTLSSTSNLGSGFNALIKLPLDGSKTGTYGFGYYVDPGITDNSASSPTITTGYNYFTSGVPGAAASFTTTSQSDSLSTTSIFTNNGGTL